MEGHSGHRDAAAALGPSGQPQGAPAPKMKAEVKKKLL